MPAAIRGREERQALEARVEVLAADYADVDLRGAGPRAVRDRAAPRSPRCACQREIRRVRDERHPLASTVDRYLRCRAVALRAAGGHGDAGDPSRAGVAHERIGLAVGVAANE